MGCCLAGTFPDHPLRGGRRKACAWRSGAGGTEAPATWLGTAWAVCAPQCQGVIACLGGSSQANAFSLQRV